MTFEAAEADLDRKRQHGKSCLTVRTIMPEWCRWDDRDKVVKGLFLSLMKARCLTGSEVLLVSIAGAWICFVRVAK